MRLLLYLLIALAAVVVAVVLIGMALPQAHVARRRATYRQPPEVVWQAITTIEEFPRWRSDVKRIDRADHDGRIAWREIGRNGELPLEIVEAQPRARLVTRIAGAKLPFGGTWTYELAPAAGGTTLTITENGEVYNPIFRFVSRFVIGHDATANSYLRALGGKFGENTEPQAVN